MTHLPPTPGSPSDARTRAVPRLAPPFFAGPRTHRPDPAGPRLGKARRRTARRSGRGLRGGASGRALHTLLADDEDPDHLQPPALLTSGSEARERVPSPLRAARMEGGPPNEPSVETRTQRMWA